jgi:hypothetical protein
MDWQQYQLGESHDDILVETQEENQQAALALASQATNSLQIFSRDLEPRIYDTPEFSEVVRQLALNHRQAKTQILIVDPDYIIKHGHRLISLARQLTSFIEVKKVHEDFANNPEAFMIVDRRGVLHRKLATRYEGTVNFNAIGQSNELATYFRDAWQHGIAYTDFRRLYI